MSFTDKIVLAAIIAALALSWGQKRGVAWALVIGAGYFVSGAYWRLGLPFHVTATAVTDTIVCYLIFRFGKHQWELWLMSLGVLAVGSSFAYGALGQAPQFYLPYSIALEAVTILSLFLIGGVGAFQLHGSHDVRAFRPWRTVFGRVRPAWRSDETAQ